jgi:peptidoglycan hydrolase-like protein with peptidoglycan-binding domain
METLAYLHLTASQGQPPMDPPLAPVGLSDPLSPWYGSPASSPKIMPFMLGVGLATLTTVMPLALPLAAQAQASLSQGASGSAVMELQQRLADRGYFSAEITGFYGSITVDAVRQFQQSQGLRVDGVAGPQTLALLYGNATASPASNTPAASNTTADFQQKLKNLGYYRGNVDGIYGPLTAQAIRDFQRDQGLPITGVMGVSELARLNNGSTARSPSTASNPLTVTPSSTTSSGGSSVVFANTSATTTSSSPSRSPDNAVILSQAAEEITVRQGGGKGSVVVQQHPERTIIEAIPSTSVVVSQPNGVTTTSTVGNPPGTAAPQQPAYGTTPYPYPNPYPYPYPGTIPGSIPGTGAPVGVSAPLNPSAYPPSIGGNPAYAAPPSYDSSYYPYVVAIPQRTQEDLMTVMRLSPGAFVAGSQRGTYINAGSYSNRADAETVTEALRQQGLDARVIFRPR